MGRSTYIKLVKGSKQTDITLAQVKDLLDMYMDRTSKTGEQLDWQYTKAAFPYKLIEKTENNTAYFYLKATDPLYNYLVIGAGSEEDGTNYIQITLPDEDHQTTGDYGKASEFAKYLASYLKAELHLFNDRIIYFNPRK